MRTTKGLEFGGQFFPPGFHRLLDQILDGALSLLGIPVPAAIEERLFPDIWPVEGVDMWVEMCFPKICWSAINGIPINMTLF